MGDVPGPDSKKISTEVSVKAACGSNGVAKRIAHLMAINLTEGMPKKDVEKMRDQMLGGYIGGEDVPDDSKAWEICRAGVNKIDSVCAFKMVQSDGKQFPFQVTAGAVGGCSLQVERIARLCWEKLNAGVPKEKVIAYRNKLYSALESSRRGEDG